MSARHVSTSARTYPPSPGPGVITVIVRDRPGPGRAPRSARGAAGVRSWSRRERRARSCSPESPPGSRRRRAGAGARASGRVAGSRTAPRRRCWRACPRSPRARRDEARHRGCPPRVRASCSTSRDTSLKPHSSSRIAAPARARSTGADSAAGCRASLGGPDHRRAHANREIAGHGHDGKRRDADHSNARKCDERADTYHQWEACDRGQRV